MDITPATIDDFDGISQLLQDNGLPVAGLFIHLHDTLVARSAGSSQAATETTAKVGKVNGIYVAELTIKQPGNYDIEFHIKNSRLDERLPLKDFKVE